MFVKKSIGSEFSESNKCIDQDVYVFSKIRFAAVAAPLSVVTERNDLRA